MANTPNLDLEKIASGTKPYHEKVWANLDKIDANNPKHKLDATTAPTVNDDTTAGYTVGSLWADVTNDNLYVCIDATAGTAIWKETTGLLEDETAPKLGAEFNAQAHSIVFTEQVLTSGAAIAWNLVNGNKAILTAAHNFTITIAPPSGALKAQLIITQDGTGTRVMDEIVTQKDEAIAVADVHADTDIIDLSVDIPTGARIRFKTTAADLPVPLVVDTIYYAIRSSENHIKVATTKANAHAGTQIDITDAGTGTHTVQQLVKWEGGTLGILSTNVGREDILSVAYKTADKQWYAQLEKNYS
ncbi:MAG: hypothetical protein KAU20_05880 [Nanoarchaeota archaeon]|nr:hypothetical protein [Nanoarchaeota archaeon]